MDHSSIIVFQYGEYIRIKKRRATSQELFDFFIDNAKVLGVTGFYVDNREDFLSLFVEKPDWDTIKTVEV